MLERIGRVRRHTRFVEEFHGLQLPEALVELLLGYRRDGLEEGDSHIFTDDGRYLQQALLGGWESVNARRQHGLDGVRHGQRGWLRTLFSDGLGEFLEEEGIAVRFRQEILEQSAWQVGVLQHRV